MTTKEAEPQRIAINDFDKEAPLVIFFLAPGLSGAVLLLLFLLA